MRFDTLWDSANSIASSLNLGQDYRKQYNQVGGSTKEPDPTFNPALMPKYTSQSIRGILRKKLLDLRNWKGETLNGVALTPRYAIKILNYSLQTPLYEFYKVGGTLLIPFELTFTGTKSKIEDKLVQKYPELVSTEVRAYTLEDLKNLHKMKKELLSGMQKEDFKDVLAFFYDKNYFRPYKKFKKFIWYNFNQIELKYRAYSPTYIVPAITMRGYIFVWGEAWLRHYLRNSEISKTVGFGYVRYHLYPRTISPIIFHYTNISLIQKWMENEIKNLILVGNNTLSNFVRKDLGIIKNNFNVIVNHKGIKDFEIVIDRVWNPQNNLIGNSNLIGLKNFNKR